MFDRVKKVGPMACSPLLLTLAYVASLRPTPDSPYLNLSAC